VSCLLVGRQGIWKVVGNEPLYQVWRDLRSSHVGVQTPQVVSQRNESNYSSATGVGVAGGSRKVGNESERSAPSTGLAATTPVSPASQAVTW
jgi:hypothetical protein